jgi:hypothetical protein
MQTISFDLTTEEKITLIEFHASSLCRSEGGELRYIRKSVLLAHAEKAIALINSIPPSEFFAEPMKKTKR